MTEESKEPISEEEAEEILRQFGESKANIHSFLTSIVKTKDTTKVGNVTSDELGTPNLPIRTFKELALFSKDVGMTSFEEYFKDMAEIITSTSLSKEGFLVERAVTQRKEFRDTSKLKKINRGWFSKKPERVSEY